VVRRWWLIGGLFAMGAAGAFGVSHYLIDVYRSETLILVVPQRVPDSYVKSTVTGRVEDRLPTISQQILSRSRLERIISDMNLYAEMRKTQVMEDVVQRMRRDIGVGIEPGDTSFRVVYISDDPKTAQKVTERLASLFIEENLRDRENQAEDTNQFLDSQLEDARRRLIEHEQKLEEYRRRHSGQLPSQAPTNLQAIQNAQLQLQSLADAINREREHRLLLERQLVDLEAPDPVLTASVTPATTPEALSNEPTEVQLEAARARLRLLETRLTPDHPDLRVMRRAVEELEARRADELKNPPPEVQKPATPADVLRQRRVRELKAQVESIDKDLKEKRAQEQQLRGVIADYQTRLEGVPTRESELVELTRDYDTLQSQYHSLLTKREDSKMAANLERRNIGEQFKVLDPARVPERPFSPNRLMIYLGGAGGGLLFGLLLTAFLEYRDSSLKYEADVTRLLELPVLALVPLMVAPEELQARRKRRMVFAGLAMLILVGGSVAAFMVWRLPL
jgi:polysaccharide chain length determinant protein (PEP-CTERM system associated)